MCLALPATNDTIMRLEKYFLTGKARWVADFNESFLNYREGDVEFDLFIDGNTRSKGFILSRLFSFLLNPNYDVGFFAISLDEDSEPNDRRLRKWILAVKSCMQKHEMKWAWLMLVGQSPSDSVKKCIKEAQDRTVGVAYADASSRQVISADAYLGRQLKKYVKIK
jgi:hypothetical protein